MRIYDICLSTQHLPSIHCTLITVKKSSASLSLSQTYTYMATSFLTVIDGPDVDPKVALLETNVARSWPKRLHRLDQSNISFRLSICSGCNMQMALDISNLLPMY